MMRRNNTGAVHGKARSARVRSARQHRRPAFAHQPTAPAGRRRTVRHLAGNRTGRRGMSPTTGVARLCVSRGCRFAVRNGEMLAGRSHRVRMRVPGRHPAVQTAVRCRRRQRNPKRSLVLLRVWIARSWSRTARSRAVHRGAPRTPSSIRRGPLQRRPSFRYALGRPGRCRCPGNRFRYRPRTRMALAHQHLGDLI